MRLCFHPTRAALSKLGAINARSQRAELRAPLRPHFLSNLEPWVLPRKTHIGILNLLSSSACLYVSHIEKGLQQIHSIAMAGAAASCP